MGVISMRVIALCVCLLIYSTILCVTDLLHKDGFWQ